MMIYELKEKDIAYDSSAFNGGSDYDKECSKLLWVLFEKYGSIIYITKRTEDEIFKPQTPSFIKDISYKTILLFPNGYPEKKQLEERNYIRKLIVGNSKSKKRRIDADIVYECLRYDIDILISNDKHLYKHCIIKLPNSGKSLQILRSSQLYIEINNQI